MDEIAARQAILHGLIAALFVEAMLQVWDIRRASSRLAFWTLALAFPFVILPAFLLLAPWRTGDRFAAGWTLLNSARWGDVIVFGVRSDHLVLGVLAAAGVALCLRDALPLLGRTRALPRTTRTASGTAATANSKVESEGKGFTLAEQVRAIVGVHSERLRIPAPTVVIADTGRSLLFVSGVRNPKFVVSAGVLKKLEARQLDAAVAHELAHVRFRDPLVGWFLMIARLVMFWNPAVQLVSRAIAQEMEHRADEVAARISGAQSLASALGVLGSAHSIGGWVASGPRMVRSSAVTHMLTLRLIAAGLTLAAILFFVV